MEVGDYIKLKDNDIWFRIVDMVSCAEMLEGICIREYKTTDENTYFIDPKSITELIPKDKFDRKYITYYAPSDWILPNIEFSVGRDFGKSYSRPTFDFESWTSKNWLLHNESLIVVGKTYYFMHKNHVESGVVLEVQIGKNKRGEDIILYSFAHDLKIPRCRCYKSKEELIKSL